MYRSKQEYIDNMFDIQTLRDVGFLKPSDKSYFDIEKRICEWFGINNIFEYDEIMKDIDDSVIGDINTFSLN